MVVSSAKSLVFLLLGGLRRLDLAICRVCSKPSSCHACCFVAALLGLDVIALVDVVFVIGCGLYRCDDAAVADVSLMLTFAEESLGRPLSVVTTQVEEKCVLSYV